MVYILKYLDISRTLVFMIQHSIVNDHDWKQDFLTGAN